MLPTQLRVLLVIGALLALLIVCNRVKKSKILMEDAIFWTVLAFVLVLLAVFPQIAICVSQALGFVSASNFVYLVVMVLLLWKVFTNSSEISRLKAKINELAQEIALAHMKEDEDTEKNEG